MTITNRPIQVPFYWKLAPADRAQQVTLIHEEEGDLAVLINEGRALVSLHHPYQSCPPVHDLPDCFGGEPEDYSDPIAAILQAAVADGLDADAIVTRARATGTGIRQGALKAAARRRSQAAR